MSMILPSRPADDVQCRRTRNSPVFSPESNTQWRFMSPVSRDKTRDRRLLGGSDRRRSGHESLRALRGGAGLSLPGSVRVVCCSDESPAESGARSRSCCWASSDPGGSRPFRDHSAVVPDNRPLRHARPWRATAVAHRVTSLPASVRVVCCSDESPAESGARSGSCWRLSSDPGGSRPFLDHSAVVPSNPSQRQTRPWRCHCGSASGYEADASVPCRS